MASRASIGDVFELATPCGLAYLQYTFETPEFGSLVRVLHDLFPSRPPTSRIAAVVSATERFAVFFPIRDAARAGMVEYIARYPLPASARRFPVMRWWHPSGDWMIVDNATEVRARVSELSAEQKLYPSVEIWPQPLLVARVASQWSWADDADEREDLVPAEPCHDIGVPWPALRDEAGEIGGADHYAYFPTREAATEAKRRIVDIAERVVVSRAADDSGQWLTKATERPEDSGELEDAMVAAVRSLGGEYDGSERRLA